MCWRCFSRPRSSSSDNKPTAWKVLTTAERSNRAAHPPPTCSSWRRSACGTGRVPLWQARRRSTRPRQTWAVGLVGNWCTMRRAKFSSAYSTAWSKVGRGGWVGGCGCGCVWGADEQGRIGGGQQCRCSRNAAAVQSTPWALTHSHAATHGPPVQPLPTCWPPPWCPSPPSCTPLASAHELPTTCKRVASRQLLLLAAFHVLCQTWAPGDCDNRPATCHPIHPAPAPAPAHLAAHVHVPALDLLLLFQQPHCRLVGQRADARLPHAGVALAQRRQPEVLALHCAVKEGAAASIMQATQLSHETEHGMNAWSSCGCKQPDCRQGASSRQQAAGSSRQAPTRARRCGEDPEQAALEPLLVVPHVALRLGRHCRAGGSRDGRVGWSARHAHPASGCAKLLPVQHCAHGITSRRLLQPNCPQHAPPNTTHVSRAPAGSARCPPPPPARQPAPAPPAPPAAGCSRCGPTGPLPPAGWCPLPGPPAAGPPPTCGPPSPAPPAPRPA